MKRLPVIVLLCSACGSSPTAPTPAPPPAPAMITISGRVSAINGGQPLPGLSTQLGSVSTTTDGAGSFSASMLPASSVSLALTGAGIVPRTVQIAASSSRTVTTDAIALGGGFDLTFYRQFVRNAVDSPTLLPLRRWTKAPNVYLQTVDDTGAAIDARTLDSTEAAIRESVQTWTSGAFGVASLPRGTESHERQAGWITVKWFADASVNKCGNADVAVEGGTVNLYPRVPNCRCVGGPEIRPRLVRHEMGHAMGYWHTDAQDDLMNAVMWTCDLQPSARERYHAAIAYARPVGNADPDQDPVGFVNLAPMRVQ